MNIMDITLAFSQQGSEYVTEASRRLEEASKVEDWDTVKTVLLELDTVSKALTSLDARINEKLNQL